MRKCFFFRQAQLPGQPLTGGGEDEEGGQDNGHPHPLLGQPPQDQRFSTVASKLGTASVLQDPQEFCDNIKESVPKVADREIIAEVLD